MLRLTSLFHGDSGVGKSWLAASGPGPRLIFDSEGRGLYLPSVSKVWWNPRTEPLPSVDRDGNAISTDTTVIIDVREFSDFNQGYLTLASGNHYFKSVGVDSLPELQQRCLDRIAGTGQVQTQQWGDLLREMDTIVRQMRDLRTHPTNPIDALIIVAGSQEKNGKQRPMLQGQLSGRVAFHFDLVGYVSNVLDGAGEVEIHCLIKPIGPYEAKDNTHILSQHYGHDIVNPNVTRMLEVLNQPQGAN